jgi:ferredoxin-NADP reductase/uncharacterized protein YcbX
VPIVPAAHGPTPGDYFIGVDRLVNCFWSTRSEFDVAHLSHIFIYPIKSLDGVAVDTARVLASGALADDRRFAIFDGLGQYVNGKRNPRVHLLRSAYYPASRQLKLAKGTAGQAATFNVFSERAGLEEWLTDFFGFAVSFRENVGVGFPDDTDSPGPTIIATATLRAIADWFGLSLEQTRARFRTNLEVDGVPPFWEDRLYGVRGTTVRFSIGNVVFDGVNPCQRCVVPARDPLTGLSVPDFAKRFVELRRKYLPEWAEPSRFNHFYRVAINTRLVAHHAGQELSVGNRIRIIGPAGVAEPPAKAVGNSAQPRRWSGRLRVSRVVDATPSVRTFRLSALDGDRLPFTFLPGQYLNIELTIDGKCCRRCYTIASAPTRLDYCELTVKRDETGIVSRHLHDHLREGMELDVSGPGGRFIFTGDEAESLVLIGAGVGITPLMSKIRYLTDRKWPGLIHLIYCARTERDIIFRQELESLTEAFPNLRVTTTLTQEPGNNWAGPRGRITSELLRRALSHPSTQRVHICGPVEMANEITRMLRETGVPAEQIKAEAFGGPSPKPSAATMIDEAGPIIGAVTFAESGKSSPVHAGQTVLDAAACVGIGIDRGCLAGICGRCKVRLLSGDIKMEVDEALDASEKSNGFILACQAKPLGNVAIDA